MNSHRFIYDYFKFPRLLGVFILFIISSCAPYESELVENPPVSLTQNSIQPAIWISEAVDYAEKITKDSALVNKTIPLFAGSEIQRRLFYNESGELVQIELINRENRIQNYFLDEGKLVFSFHNLRAEGGNGKTANSLKSFVIAYINYSPFSAAVRNLNANEVVTTSSKEFKHLELSEIPQEVIAEKRLLMESIVDLKIIKRTTESPIRLNTENKENSSFTLKGAEKVMVFDTRKGEQLSINLHSPNPNLFFRLSPDNGSNMEYRNWWGKSPVNGDFWISVFTIDQFAADSGYFNLAINRY